MLSSTFFLLVGAMAQSVWGDSNNLETHVDSLELTSEFTPVILTEFMNNPHHVRTPFAVSPDGKSGYLAYLEGSNKVHVHKVSLNTFKKDGNDVTIDGAIEASGLVAHNDGFALLTHFNTTGQDSKEYWIPTVVRYKDKKQAWSTPVGGKTVTFHMAPNTKFRANKGSLDGDLKFGENGTYAAFFRAEYYDGDADGHGGDSIVYLDDNGLRIDGKYSQTQHCGHNFGIALSTSKEIPFAAVCTADYGKISIASSKEDTMPTIGKDIPEEFYGAEAFGGNRGGYSDLARMDTAESYLLVWVARPEGGSEKDPRIVRIAQLSAKDTVGQGPKDVTQKQTSIDCVNARITAIDDSRALVTWEENDISKCGGDFNGYGCGQSKYTGTKFQVVDASAANQGPTFSSTEVFVSGDIVKVGSKLCWPYVNIEWNSSTDQSWSEEDRVPASTVKKLSFACYSPDGSSVSTPESLVESSSISYSAPSTAASALAGTSVAASAEPFVTDTKAVAIATPADTDWHWVSDSFADEMPTDQASTATFMNVDWSRVAQFSASAVPTTLATVVWSWSGRAGPPFGHRKHDQPGDVVLEK